MDRERPDGDVITVGHPDVGPVQLLAKEAHARHQRLERVSAWPCSEDEFEPAAAADGDVVYCANCKALLWRRGVAE